MQIPSVVYSNESPEKLWMCEKFSNPLGFELIERHISQQILPFCQQNAIEKSHKTRFKCFNELNAPIGIAEASP